MEIEIVFLLSTCSCSRTACNKRETSVSQWQESTTLTSKDYYFDSYAHFGIHEVTQKRFIVIFEVVGSAPLNCNRCGVMGGKCDRKCSKMKSAHWRTVDQYFKMSTSSREKSYLMLVVALEFSACLRRRQEHSMCTRSVIFSKPGLHAALSSVVSLVTPLSTNLILIQLPESSIFVLGSFDDEARL